MPIHPVSILQLDIICGIIGLMCGRISVTPIGWLLAKWCSVSAGFVQRWWVAGCLWDVPQRSRDLKSFWFGLFWSNLIFVVTNHGNCLQFTVKGFQVSSNLWINFCNWKYKMNEYFGTISVPFDFFLYLGSFTFYHRLLNFLSLP